MIQILWKNESLTLVYKKKSAFNTQLLVFFFIKIQWITYFIKEKFILKINEHFITSIYIVLRLAH